MDAKRAARVCQFRPAALEELRRAQLERSSAQTEPAVKLTAMVILVEIARMVIATAGTSATIVMETGRESLVIATPHPTVTSDSQMFPNRLNLVNHGKRRQMFLRIVLQTKKGLRAIALREPSRITGRLQRIARRLENVPKGVNETRRHPVMLR
jgi:hypothetical protein